MVEKMKKARQRIRELQEIAEKRGYSNSILGAPKGSQYAQSYDRFLTYNEKMEYYKLSRKIRGIK